MDVVCLSVVGFEGPLVSNLLEFAGNLYRRAFLGDVASAEFSAFIRGASFAIAFPSPVFIIAFVRRGSRATAS
jgi:hypothetical protein